MNFKSSLCLIIGILVISSCASSKKAMTINSKQIDVQGHRGARGVLPENTIEAFMYALEIGVTTLEMDLVISRDKEVVVSHEPFFNHEISTSPDGVSITKEIELEHNIYKMDYDEISNYDVGLKTHPRFSAQRNQQAHKPRFLDVVHEAESLSSKLKRSKPYYNVEIKRNPKYDNTYHPNATEFAQLVVDAVQKTGIKDRIVIQSFDIESLQVTRKIDPDIKLVLLIENQNSPQSNLDKLGFIPDIYSPYFKLIDKNLVNLCKEKNMQLIPWTVNSEEDLLAMLEMGVDGIISDFPKRLIDILNRSNQYSIR